MPNNEYNTAQAAVEKVPEHVHTVTTVTKDTTVQVAPPAPIVVEKTEPNKRRVENGFGM